MSGFDRVPFEHRPTVEAARALIPAKIHELMQPRFCVGASPYFIGLHSHAVEDLDACYGVLSEWTFEDLAHAMYEEQLIVFPRPELYPGEEVRTLLHEWGHLFDHVTSRSLQAPETTPYSRVNRAERIAEAFALTLDPPSTEWALYMGAEAFGPLRSAMGVG